MARERSKVGCLRLSSCCWFCFCLCFFFLIILGFIQGRDFWGLFFYFFWSFLSNSKRWFCFSVFFCLTNKRPFGDIFLRLLEQSNGFVFVARLCRDAPARLPLLQARLKTG